MTKKEFEKLGRQLLPEMPGFMAKGDLVFAHPVGHTLRAICFERSIGARDFYAWVFILPLFVPEKVIALNFGWRLGGRSHFWNADAPGLIGELGSVIKREALPFLNKIKTPRDVAEAGISLKKTGDPIVQQAVAFAFARAGDSAKAVVALDQFLEQVKKTGYWHDEIKRAEALKATLLANPAEAQRQLEAWENETAKNLGLEKFR